MSELEKQLKQIKNHSGKLAQLSGARRKSLLLQLARAILRNEKRILKANRNDCALLNDGSPLRERLELNPRRIEEMANSTNTVAKLPDPLNRTIATKILPNGLRLKKVTVPLGVIGVIYESRPNVTVDIAALALKSGNAVILKGGKECYETNNVLAAIIQNVLKKNRLPTHLVHLIDPAEDWKSTLLNARSYVDVIIPRGGQKLIEYVRKKSKIPVIETGAGVCHAFADRSCHIPSAIRIIVNGKTQRPSVCNSLDTLVIHSAICKPVLQALNKPLSKESVTILADAPSHAILKKYYPSQLLRRARSTDYGREFLSLRLAVKTVPSFTAGLKFVQKHTSGHSETILTANKIHAEIFFREIDAAVLYHNASTRFTDGGEFGFGAEVGVSTQKLHARGPMGAEALISYKWLIRGNGQIRT